MTGWPRNEWGNQVQWAITAPLLAAQILGHTWALPAVLGFCALTVAWYAWKHRSWRVFRVQVRLGFMGFCLLGFVPSLAAILWIPLLGTSAQVLVGYCPMARFLRMMPWNRETSLSLREAIGIVAGPPGDEGVLWLL